MAHVIKWSESEIKFLKKNYLMDLGDIAKKIDRTEEDISNKMFNLGIIKNIEDAPGYLFNIFKYSGKIWDRFMLKLRPKWNLKELIDIHTEKDDPYVKYSELYHLTVIIQELEDRIAELEK
jgi:hypothetical protein